MAKERKKYLIFIGKKKSKHYSNSFVYFANSKKEAYSKAKHVIFANIPSSDSSEQYNIKKIKEVK